MKRNGQTASHGVDSENFHFIFSEANKNVHKALDSDSKEMELWNIHLLHLQGVNQKGKDRRTRFDPMILKWEIHLLAKISHSVYEEVSRVMKLPTLSYILRKNKEIVGE